MCLRSGSTRIVPVVKVNACAARRLDLNRGKLIRRPRRSPFLDLFQLSSASASAWQPQAYASFEFSGHHGVPSSRTATCYLIRFQSRRRLIIDQPSTGVSSASAIPYVRSARRWARFACTAASIVLNAKFFAPACERITCCWADAASNAN